MTHARPAFRAVIDLERTAQSGRSKEDRLLCQCERDARLGHLEARHRLEQVPEVARRRGFERVGTLDEVKRADRGRRGRVHELVGGCAGRHAGAEGVIVGEECRTFVGRASRKGGGREKGAVGIKTPPHADDPRAAGSERGQRRG